jgi:hypothetical protein
MSEFVATWLTDAEAFFLNLKTLGGEFDHFYQKILKPLSTPKVAQLASSFALPIPPVIHDIWVTNTSCAKLRYYWIPSAERSSIAESLYNEKEICGGGSLFDAEATQGWIDDCREFATGSWLTDPAFKADQELWLNSFPFMRMENGDYLAIGANGTCVVYLSHDGKSFVVAGTLEQFLTAWGAIGYVGPESWVIERFLNPTTKFLSEPNRSQATRIAKLFGP